ncbi:GUN4 domain-containing protein [Microcoleus sp. ARI1-B5]|uniref:GUN4 domain-containing protein n=1 Tax=unclassified Microcoleus TaxID=2642155 RepID=UPI002FD5A2ED
MIKLHKQSLALALSGTFLAVLQPAFTVNAQETNSELGKLQSLLESKKWYEADQETVSLIRNNPANLSCPNLRAIDRLWMQSSNGKYGLTPQLEIWQKVGGSTCRTCEGQIQQFSQQVRWNLGSPVSPIPGDFPGQYPTVAALSWQSYVDSDNSFTRNSLFAGGQTWQAWRVTEFNLFSTFANCGK